MLPLRRPLALITAITALGLVISGCGPKYPETIPVTGTVTLDGQPVPGAAVVFTPEGGEEATGTTDASGRFELSTFQLGDGAVPGRHRVTVAKTTVEPGEEEKVVFIVPKVYGNRSTSPLTCDVRKEIEPLQVRYNLSSKPDGISSPASQDTPPVAEPTEPPIAEPPTAEPSEPPTEAAPAP